MRGQLPAIDLRRPAIERYRSGFCDVKAPRLGCSIRVFAVIASTDPVTRTCPQCQSPCEDAHKFCPSCGFPVAKVAQNSDDPLIGRTLPGGYVILDLVGIGGMGRVYRAEQTNLGRTVAV